MPRYKISIAKDGTRWSSQGSRMGGTHWYFQVKSMMTRKRFATYPTADLHPNGSQPMAMPVIWPKLNARLRHYLKQSIKLLHASVSIGGHIPWQHMHNALVLCSWGSCEKSCPETERLCGLLSSGSREISSHVDCHVFCPISKASSLVSSYLPLRVKSLVHCI